MRTVARAAPARAPRWRVRFGVRGWLGLILTALVVAGAVLAPVLSPTDPLALDGLALQPPSAVNPLGTDDLGRDVLSGLLHGGQASLLVALGVALVVFVVGLLVGVTSGYAGGALDDLLMRGTEAVQVLPRFFLAVVVIALFGPGLDRIVLVLGFTSWPFLARVVRAEVLSLREREYVEAARALGGSTRWILGRHLLPQLVPIITATITLEIAQVLLIEASLGFLGLSDPATVTWGTIIGNSRNFFRAAWWLAVFPGAVVVIATLGVNLLGEALAAPRTGARV